MLSLKDFLPPPSIKRLPMYLRHARKKRAEGETILSCSGISSALGYQAVQIRKDLAMTGLKGKPKVGYDVDQLITSLEQFLGWDRPTKAILIGVGHLGEAILTFPVLKEFGLAVVAAFSLDAQKIGTVVGTTPIFHPDRLEEEGEKSDASIAIFSSDTLFQYTVDLALRIKSIRAVWNFAPSKPQLPPGILYEEVRLGASLAMLTSQMRAAVNNT
jgi:redox-sensing transcriptional repressor